MHFTPHLLSTDCLSAINQNLLKHDLSMALGLQTDKKGNQKVLPTKIVLYLHILFMNVVREFAHQVRDRRKEWKHFH